MKFIDPHIHLFDRDSGDYQWLKAENAPYWPDKSIINRDFNPSDLVVDSPLALSGVVHIEAGFNNEQPWLEIEWVERQITSPLRTIGYADLTLHPDEFKNLIDRYMSYNSTVGIRHIFDNDAVTLVKHPNTLPNLQYLAAVDFIFETQIAASDCRAVNSVIEIFAAVPNLVIILSHCCFAPLKTREFKHWQDNMRRLAQSLSVFIKASGWEMVDRQYTKNHVLKILSLLLDSFGEKRVMLASNFPLTLFSQPYQCLWQSYQSIGIEESLLSALCYDNAHAIYRFNDELR